MHVAHKGCSPNGIGSLVGGGVIPPARSRGVAPENFRKLAVWRRNLRAPETDFLHSRVGAQADKSPQFTMP